MFHAERHKYAPLKGTYLLYFGGDKKLNKELEVVCAELGLSYSHTSQKDELARIKVNGSQNSIVVSNDKLSGLSKLLDDLSYDVSQVIVLNGASSSEQRKNFKVISTSNLEEKEQAMKIMDNLLSMVQTEVSIDEHFEPVNFDYLKSTFSEKDQRYKQLIEMMFLEFLEAKEIMSEAFEKGNIEKYREYKHKLQPSVNYLRMTDLINVMEAIKQNFDHLDEKRNKHLVPKMMKYFDTILEALAMEKS